MFFSELMRKEPVRHVLDWAEGLPVTQVFTTAVTRAEVFYGVEALPEGRRKRTLHQDAEELFLRLFPGRILAFDVTAADWYAHLRAHRRRIGRAVAPFDIQIAAIARARGAAVATRNVSDFADCGIELIDPWQA